MNLASLPSPSRAVWEIDLGFVTLPIRAYALCIIAGIIAAGVITDRRMRSRGAAKGAAIDIAVWAVPFGIVGGRIYHVLSSPDAYFGPGGDLAKALRIWEGGLGIWGAVAGGAIGAWIACRQLRLPFTLVADSVAVGLPVAQAVGRLGNWFNNELYGARADDLPWGLQVYKWRNGAAERTPDGSPLYEEGLYHPTFLYELLWNLGVAGLVLWLDRKYKFGKGRAFALYVMAYTAGRVWIEMLRIDDDKTVVRLLGQRLNVWTSVAVFLAALVYFLIRKGSAREYVIPAADGELTVVSEADYRAYQIGEGRHDADTQALSGGSADTGSAGSTSAATKD